MNDKKLQRLFESARQESAPRPPAGFAEDMLRRLRQEPAPAHLRPASVFDQLNVLFPRLALAAVAVIILCLAVDFGLTSAGLPDLDDAASQLVSQFDLNGDGL